jgi:multidrug efflux pump subunit AcrB
MWLVRIALQRPYTFVVMAMLIVLLGLFTIERMPKDILPEVDIPVAVVVWSYGGLTPEEMEKRVVSGFERFLITTVNDIEHTESQSLTGVAIVKLFFHPGAKIEAAVAQVTAASQTALRSLPPGATPPLILRCSAANAPVLQLVMESERLTEQQLFDLGVNFVRAGVATVPGAGVPYPYGGKFRQVMVDIDLGRLYAWGLSPRDVTNAINLQNLVLPTGNIKMGVQDYPVLMNSSPETLESLAALPIRSVNGRTVYVRDVANVRDGFAPQTSIVHANDKRAVVMPILKSAGASTLELVSKIREKLPAILDTLPKEIKLSPVFDQSLFVRAAIQGVAHEALIAGALTALMMLLFLGSWRSTLIVVVSIPLSILVAIIGLRLSSARLRARQRRPARAAQGLLAGGRAVLGYDHGAQHRARQPGERGQRHSPIQAREPGQRARLPRPASEPGARDQARPVGARAGRRAAGPHLRGQGGPHRRNARRANPHAARGDPHRESAKRAALGHVRQRGSAGRQRAAGLDRARHGADHGQ